MSNAERWKCGACSYVYNSEHGEPRADVPPGTPWPQVPREFHCPLCGATKSQFHREKQF